MPANPLTGPTHQSLMDGTEYITLKEASELSGYTPDYVGQLIRRGKLPGKQVYVNIAWVTPRSAVIDYLAQKGKKVEPLQSVFSPVAEIEDISKEPPLSRADRMFFWAEDHERFLRIVTLSVIGVLACILLGLCALFLLSTNHHLLPDNGISKAQTGANTRV